MCANVKPKLIVHVPNAWICSISKYRYIRKFANSFSDKFQCERNACRYELLGDCVLKLTVCMYLMRTEGHRKCEGQMTTILHKMVSNRDLFDAAIVRTLLLLSFVLSI